MDQLSIKAQLTVLKPSHKVFEAIVDPSQMANYFIEKSTGPLEEGKTVLWKFPEFDMEFPICVGKVEADKHISYTWKDEKDIETLVEIRLEPKSDNATIVRVTEGSREKNDEGITWLMRNTEGWANFLACLKAWMEFGINLRKGAFELSQMPEERDS